ncbi:MAG: hypothetical protein HY548_01065, partial [Elusimicrobia bacterium]|nr:hypothetical protein [Elusimicrobiota bacterium]
DVNGVITAAGGNSTNWNAAYTNSHGRGHNVADTLDHTDWPAGLTAAELGFLDGATSSIQTQLGTKASTASPTFTGSVTMPGTGVWNSSGNVGIGTASPGAGLKLDVQGGDINASGKLKEGGNALIPAGAVMFFNLVACPAGWTELTVARGRYIVGLPLSGTLAGTQGTALSNLQNRAVGSHDHAIPSLSHSHGHDNAQHLHGITDPGHKHKMGGAFVTNGGTTYNTSNWNDPGNPSQAETTNVATDITINNAATGITISAADPGNILTEAQGSVAGTNAPYIQLRVCQKD